MARVRAAGNGSAVRQGVSAEAEVHRLHHTGRSRARERAEPAHFGPDGAAIHIESVFPTRAERKRTLAAMQIVSQLPLARAGAPAAPGHASEGAPEVSEVTTLAAALVCNCGWRVFPCHGYKRPACPHGFKNASNDPDAIADLWRRFPGPLIGVATGAASGIDVLDFDVKHDAALAWWRANQHRIPATRSFRTRSGGVHLYLRHAAGLGCSAGKLAPGIDVRGDGGYAISWFAAGLECLDHAPAAPWPAWMLALLLPKPAPAQRPMRSMSQDRVDGILRLVANALQGERNTILHWGSCRLGERVLDGQLGANEAEEMLVTAAFAAGLAIHEARATVRSGLRRTMR